jgi:hypothetical protein
VNRTIKAKLIISVVKRIIFLRLMSVNIKK